MFSSFGSVVFYPYHVGQIREAISYLLSENLPLECNVNSGMKYFYMDYIEKHDKGGSDGL